MRLVFNAVEPGGDGLTVTDLTVKFYMGDDVVAAIDGSFSLASTLTGNGNSGFLVHADAQQQSFLNTHVFGQSGYSDYRIALESTITGSAGGPESFSALPAMESVSVVPEPETYAMLLSGLGLIGFATRRRKLEKPLSKFQG